MASITIQALPEFPNGTTVKAYPRANWNGPVIKTAAPVGTETESAAASGGNVAFTALAANTRYVAYALVSSQHKYKDFSTRTSPATGGTGGGVIEDARGSLGATATLDLSATTEDVVVVTGTLTANHTLTISNRRPCLVILDFVQNGTGGWTLTVSDGTTPTLLTVPTAANAAVRVEVDCPNSTDMTLAVTSSGLSVNTINAKGDLLAGTADDTVSRLAVGANDTVLTADSAQATGLKWAAASGGIAATLIDAKGDLIAGSAADTAARVAVGTNDQVLTADSAQSAGVKWATVALSGVVFPLIARPTDITASQPASGNNQIRGVRAIIPKAGTLNNLYVWVGTQSGNYIGIVYDDGTASAGNKTKLWDSGSVACGAANGWRKIGDPGLTVTRGQHVDLAVQVDNTTVALGRPATVVAAAITELPSALLVAPGGIAPKLSWSAVAASFVATATISEANALQNANPIFLMAQVT